MPQSFSLDNLAADRHRLIDTFHKHKSRLATQTPTMDHIHQTPCVLVTMQISFRARPEDFEDNEVKVTCAMIKGHRTVLV
jgi:hypothetical protein